MYNPLTTWVAKIHIEEQLNKAEINRRAAVARRSQPGYSQRIGLALGEALIATGEKLRERYDPGSCETCYETL